MKTTWTRSLKNRTTQRTRILTTQTSAACYPGEAEAEPAAGEATRPTPELRRE